MVVPALVIAVLSPQASDASTGIDGRQSYEIVRYRWDQSLEMQRIDIAFAQTGWLEVRAENDGDPQLEWRMHVTEGFGLYDLPDRNLDGTPDLLEKARFTAN